MGKNQTNKPDNKSFKADKGSANKSKSGAFKPLFGGSGGAGGSQKKGKKVDKYSSDVSFLDLKRAAMLKKMAESNSNNSNNNSSSIDGDHVNGGNSNNNSSNNKRSISSDNNNNNNNINNNSGSDGPRQLSSLQQQFSKKLQGGQFRFINEKLYTRPGEASFKEFQEDPGLFDQYHSGYKEQVMGWPENPLDRVINWINKLNADSSSSSSNASNSNSNSANSNNNISGNASNKKGGGKAENKLRVVADMGCGEGRLALSVPNKVHSFDLVSRRPDIIACDIAHVPLPSKSVDIVVFCLSLMGTNIGEFLLEANRILKLDGLLKIIEVRSRFEGDKGGVKKFIKVIKRSGFAIINNSAEIGPQGSENTMFFELDCRKIDATPRIDASYSVKACIYKRR